MRNCRPITFVIFMSPLSKQDYEIFERFLQTNSCYVCNTADKALHDVLSYISRHGIATFYVNERFRTSLCGIPTSSFGAASPYLKNVLEPKLNQLCRGHVSTVKTLQSTLEYII